MKKKILALGVCTAMLATAIVGGTMAYFTDTDQAENVFTVGNIDIDLHEYKEDGTTPFEEVKNIMPGMTYGKVVNVENTGKNDAYVRVKIVIPENMTPVWNTDAVGSTGSNKEWETTATDLNTWGEFVFTRKAKLVADDDNDETTNHITSAILKAVKLNEDVTELNAKDTYEVLVSAEAIQSDSFATAEEAYAALSTANVAAKKSVTNVDELNTELGTAQLVQMSNNIDAGKDIVMADGAVLDGSGYTLNKTSDVEPSVNAGVKSVGGTIKNITVKGTSVQDAAETKGFRAVYVTNGLSSDLVIENATLSGTYALNITGASTDKTLTVKDSTLNGWTSFAEVADAKFENVTFGTEEGYHTLRPYSDVVLNNCNFDIGFVIDVHTDLTAGVTITLNGCKVNNEAVTAANFATKFDANGVTVLKNKGCTVVVDGTTVAF